VLGLDIVDKMRDLVQPVHWVSLLNFLVRVSAFCYDYQAKGRLS